MIDDFTVIRQKKDHAQMKASIPPKPAKKFEPPKSYSQGLKVGLTVFVTDDGDKYVVRQNKWSKK